MGDHTEAISIDFDPNVISYEKLLVYFWNGHRCQYSGMGRQYMNAVFYQNDEQKKIAEASRSKQAEQLGIKETEVKTKIIPVGEFTYAEGYHQKYALTRQHDLRDFLEQTYPSSKELADSTVATRLNAYLGNGAAKDWKAFLQELPSYGLPENLESQVRKIAERKQ
ncbi:hypothetical protein NT6N_26270 [Oceaniferula spumae]|uniref:peptide-methionine (S)-S-oxide reductase n=1 Tax=Oceaniferula spumae TaxID=2979115 RepID=A0AAT9FNN7_9BACT